MQTFDNHPAAPPNSPIIAPESLTDSTTLPQSEAQNPELTRDMLDQIDAHLLEMGSHVALYAKALEIARIPPKVRDSTKPTRDPERVKKEQCAIKRSPSEKWKRMGSSGWYYYAEDNTYRRMSTS